MAAAVAATVAAAVTAAAAAATAAAEQHEEHIEMETTWRSGGGEHSRILHGRPAPLACRCRGPALVRWPLVPAGAAPPLVFLNGVVVLRSQDAL